MKIGLVCPYSVFRHGGVQSYVRALHVELKSRGHDVKIIAPNAKNAPRPLDPDLLLVSHARPVNTPFHTTVDVSMRVDGLEIDELLEKEQFDILHFHEPWVPLMPMQILGRSQCVNIATFHAKLPESVLNKGIEKVAAPYTKQVFKDLDYLTAVSDAAASYVRTLAGGTPITIIPNGINLQTYNPRKVEPLPEYTDERKTILFIGRLEKRKGTIWLLKAYQELLARHDNVRLVIVGDGPKRTTLEQFVTLNNLSNVEFLGFVSEEEKLRLLRSADLFCSPALYGESFGIVLLEAMAMGTVTVCGNNIGYESVMQDRGRLSVVNPKMTSEFAERLELMLYDDQIRKLWQTWAKQYIKQFDYPVIVDRYEEIYHDLIKKRGR